MKNLKFLFLIASIALAMVVPMACSKEKGVGEEPKPDPDTPVQPVDPTPVQPEYRLLHGADISWYTEMAADGKKFYTPNGTEMQCPELMRFLGMGAARFRVWVDPEAKTSKFNDADDVVAKAKAAQKAGLEVMIDFHYSDWFADPGRQDIPDSWGNAQTLESLKIKVAEHTAEVLKRIKGAGVYVKYVQIGNETRNGMLWPVGQLWNQYGDIPNGWNNFCTLVNAGYSAAKEVFPKAVVMVHLNHAYEDNQWWVERFLTHGGKTDAIAYSHYPETDATHLSWEKMNVLAIENIAVTYGHFDLPVMVSEIGVKVADVELGSRILADFMKKINNLDVRIKEAEGGHTSAILGVFYWEPEVYGGWKPAWYNKYGWNAYELGAFLPDGRPSKIITQAFFTE